MTEPPLTRHRPCIGVFDSGFGGLTVLRALIAKVPEADFLYLGDTARLPYGSKSAETITRYTSAAVAALVERGAKLIVIACNTASALALPHLLKASPIPLVGVIKPGAGAVAASAAEMNGPVLVLATEATVASHAYASACAAHGLQTFEKACPLLVPLIEEGWTDRDVTAEVGAIYLREALSEMREQYGLETAPCAVLLGCTHYPLVRPLLQKIAGNLMPPLPFVDSAEATAAYTRTLLPQPETNSSAPRLSFFATDSTEKFQRLGTRFLGRELGEVQKIDLDL